MTKIISKWYIYLSLVLVSTVVFCIAVNAKTAPKEDERISFFVGSPDYKKEELENKLNSNREDAIKTVNLYYHHINASNFTFIFSSFRENSDFFILPIDYVNKQKDSVIKYSAHIDTNYVNSIFNEELEYCEFDGEAKGFKIYDASKDEGILTSYITYESEQVKCDYYLFFGFGSCNIGELNVKNKTMNAFELIKELKTLWKNTL